jgi:hypothetical protein
MATAIPVQKIGIRIFHKNKLCILVGIFFAFKKSANGLESFLLLQGRAKTDVIIL